MNQIIEDTIKLILIAIIVGMIFWLLTEIWIDRNYPVEQVRILIKYRKPPEPQLLLAATETLLERELEIIGYRITTSYNPVPEQTDDTPCITASGMNICVGVDKMICASNEFEFGDILVLGNTGIECEVQDRTNEKYSYRVDLLMYDLQEAKNWGRKILLIKIIK